jgi:DNA-binding response OmpR family regulator
MGMIGFGATLPLSQPSRQPLSAALPGARFAAAAAGGKTGKHIMVIDDEPDILRFFRDFLTAEGHYAVCAGNWREAVKLLAVSMPDLIVLDILLPEVNGFIIAETLKKEMRLSVPVLVYSALRQPEDIMTGLSVGGNAFLRKPASLHDLHAAISLLLFEAARNSAPARQGFAGRNVTAGGTGG